MNNFIFKSPRRLIKNSFNKPEEFLMVQFEILKEQSRYLRQDLVDVKLMLNKLLIDKHLQMQVDKYFDDPDGGPDDAGPPPEDDKE